MQRTDDRAARLRPLATWYSVHDEHSHDMAPSPKVKRPTTAEILKALGQDERIEILKCFEPVDGAGAVEISCTRRATNRDAAHERTTSN
jgi:hypothetical protein